MIPPIEPRPALSSMWKIEESAAAPAYDRTLADVAVHEAGHIVLCMSVGVAVTAAALDAGGGLVTFAPASADARRDIDEYPRPLVQAVALEMAAIHVAGRMAEHLRRGLPHTGRLFYADSDWRKAETYLRTAFASTVPLGYCQRYARAVLTEKWATVERLADALTANGELTGQEIIEIQGRAA